MLSNIPSQNKLSPHGGLTF